MKWVLAALVVTALGDEQTTDRLLEWCEKGGAGLGAGVGVGQMYEDVAPRGLFASMFNQQDAVRGLVATQALEKHAIVARVPLLTGLAIHASEWSRSVFGQQCKMATRAMEELTNDYLLAAMVAGEANAPDSHWKPYLDAISLIDVPRTWHKSDLELLPDFLLKRAKNQRAQDRRAHRVLLESCSLQAPRLETLAWAAAVFASRGRRVQARNSNGDVVHLRQLLPLVDLLNWSPDPNVACGSTANNVVECLTTRQVPAGAALTVAYEKTKPSDFLFDYGFVPTTGLDCDDSATKGDLALKFEAVKRQINKLENDLAHHGHYESRGDLIRNVLYQRRSCIRKLLPNAHDDDTQGRGL